VSYVVVYATFPNRKSAGKVVRHLVKERLIVCANSFTVESEYWWKKKIEKAREVATLMKTSSKNFAKVRKEIIKMHPYQVPVIEKIKASANSSAEKWLKNYLE
jgi:periplasmic divalent cation tolerance protein